MGWELQYKMPVALRAGEGAAEAADAGERPLLIGWKSSGFKATVSGELIGFNHETSKGQLRAGLYEIRVRCKVAGAGESPWSATLRMRTKVSAPSAPAKLRMTHAGSREVEVEWKASANSGSPVDGYEVTWHAAESTEAPPAPPPTLPSPTAGCVDEVKNRSIAYKDPCCESLK